MERKELIERIDRAVEELSDELVDFAIRLFSIPTQNPPGNNYPEFAEAFADEMRKIGMEVEFCEVPEDRLAELNSRLEASAEEIPGHIGLFNTNSRIKLIFGEEYGLTVLSDENNGTVVRIRYPAVETMPQREQPHKTTAAVTAP